MKLFCYEVNTIYLLAPLSGATCLRVMGQLGLRHRSVTMCVSHSLSLGFNFLFCKVRRLDDINGP